MPELPHIGKMGKSTTTIVVIGVGAVGVILYVKHKQNQAALTTSTQGQVSPYGYGYAYGMGYGGIHIGYGYGMGYGGLGYGGFGGTQYPYNVGTSFPSSPAATTNAEWSQAALQALRANGFSGAHVLTALGRYLRGQSLNHDQEQVVNDAIAIEGYPPVSGPNNYPPNMHRTGNRGQGGNHTVPDVVGQDWTVARKNIIQAGFKAKRIPAQTGRAKLIVTSQTPHAGTEARRNTTVTVHVRQVGK